VNLEIKIDIFDNFALVHIAGEVDLYSSPALRKEILNLTKKKIPIILIDLKKVNYMDSSGVATLIEGLQLSNKFDGRFALVGLNPNVREVFELTRLDKIFDIYKDVDSALESDA
jgi:anti-sigma B factor antagonist